MILLAFSGVAFAQVRAVTPAAGAQFEFSFPATNGSTQHITLDHFLFNGQPSTPAGNASRTRPLGPGVSEISIDGQTVGEWEFDVADDSSYFGLGERFDRLNHAHSIIRNGSRDAGNATSPAWANESTQIDTANDGIAPGWTKRHPIASAAAGVPGSSASSGTPIRGL